MCGARSLSAPPPPTPTHPRAGKRGAVQAKDRSLGQASAAQATVDFDKIASHLVANASPPLPSEHRGPVQTAVAALVLKLFKSSSGGWWLGQVMRGCLMGEEGAWQAGQRVCARPEVCSLRTAGFWTGQKDPAKSYDDRKTNAAPIKQRSPARRGAALGVWWAAGCAQQVKGRALAGVPAAAGPAAGGPRGSSIW